MSFIRTIIELFSLYILYKIVFDFIVPIANTTKQVKKQFDDMHKEMKEQQAQQQYTNYQQTNTAPKKSTNEDYIDFEEVK